MSQLSEKEKALRGELYYAFSPQLQAERQRCFHACERYNNAGEISRRELITLWRDIVPNAPPLPPVKADEKEEEEQLLVFPWVERPFCVDYGSNVYFGRDVYINFNCTILDTCKVTIGDRCLFGPNVSLYAATHPLDPAVRNGTRGPELGAEIHIEADCWIGGGVIVLPNVTIGRGAAIGAGSVVTKDVPAFHVAAGNPARVIRKIKTAMDPSQNPPEGEPDTIGAEVVIAEASHI